MQAEFMAKQVIQARKEKLKRICEAIVEKNHLRDSTTAPLPERDRCASLLQQQTGEKPEERDVDFFVDYLEQILRPHEYAQKQAKAERELNDAITRMFASWKEPTDENYRNQMGRVFSKTQSALELARFLGRSPSQDETEHMWFRKSLEIGVPYEKLDIRLGG